MSSTRENVPCFNVIAPKELSLKGPSKNKRQSRASLPCPQHVWLRSSSLSVNDKQVMTWYRSMGAKSWTDCKIAFLPCAHLPPSVIMTTIMRMTMHMIIIIRCSAFAWLYHWRNIELRNTVDSFLNRWSRKSSCTLADYYQIDMIGPKSLFNSLWPSDAIWQHGCRSTLVHVMACYLTDPSH